MVTVFASLLFALPTSLAVCVARGLGLLQGSSVVLVALLAIPTVATIALLLVQAFRTPQRHARRAGCGLPFYGAALGGEQRRPVLERAEG